jgi:hypothetical protein
MKVKQEVAFLNHSARRDSDLASLDHRGAGSAKDFCPGDTGVFNTARSGAKVFWFFFLKKNILLASDCPAP